MNGKTKLTFIADLHHFSQTLGTSGRAYELRSGSDQKCLAETGGIIDSAFAKISTSDTDAVLILGDITNDGEKVSHEEIREKLIQLQKKKDVYLITATHDWCCDENPRRFVGNNVFHDVPTLHHDELRDFYFDFGPKQSKSEFITHLGTCSYTVDIGEKVRILALNDDQNGKGRAGFTENHFQWIESEIKKASDEEKFLIGMEHHLLIAHIHPMIMGGSTCVGDREEVASRLADAGLRYMFVGHSHIQCIDTFTSEKGNSITEINVGSLCGYPSPIVQVEIDEDNFHIHTENTEKFTFNGITYDALAYTGRHANQLVDNVLDAAINDKKDFIERISALQVSSDKLGLLYTIAHPIAKYVKRMTVKDGYKKLRLIGLGKYYDKRLVEEFATKPVIDFAHEILHSALDGGKKRHTASSSYYKIVMTFVSLSKRFKDCETTRNICDCVSNILLGSKDDINDCTLKNSYKH